MNLSQSTKQQIECTHPHPYRCIQIIKWPALTIRRENPTLCINIICFYLHVQSSHLPDNVWFIFSYFFSYPGFLLPGERSLTSQSIISTRYSYHTKSSSCKLFVVRKHFKIWEISDISYLASNLLTLLVGGRPTLLSTNRTIYPFWSSLSADSIYDICICASKHCIYWFYIMV